MLVVVVVRRLARFVANNTDHRYGYYQQQPQEQQDTSNHHHPKPAGRNHQNRLARVNRGQQQRIEELGEPGEQVPQQRATNTSSTINTRSFKRKSSNVNRGTTYLTNPRHN